MSRIFRHAFFNGPVRVFLALVALEAALGAYLFVVPGDGIAMRRLYTRMENVADPDTFEAVRPAGPPAALAETDVAFLREWTRPALEAAPDDLARMVAVREQVHRAIPIGPEINLAPNPVPGLREAFRRGEVQPAALCGTFARLLVAAVRVGGYDARLLHLRPTVTGPASPWLDPNTGHYTAEIFLPSLKGWVVMDPLYNAHFLVDGRPGGVLALHQVLRPSGASRRVEVVQGPTQVRGMNATTLLPYFVHLSVIGDTAFRSGPEMLLRGERVRIVHWLDPDDPPLRPRDGMAVSAFTTLGVGLIVAGGFGMARAGLRRGSDRRSAAGGGIS